jgi:hypothetical protein
MCFVPQEPIAGNVDRERDAWSLAVERALHIEWLLDAAAAALAAGALPPCGCVDGGCRACRTALAIAYFRPERRAA